MYAIEHGGMLVSIALYELNIDVFAGACGSDHHLDRYKIRVIAGHGKKIS
ncbi:hypothetical protein GO496_22780 [Acidovorax citrulli]|nr:hypothetical protein [Paracidovorax citrulli]MVT37614.1 hypothetical protein [Paracidovorax citrulli]